MRPGNVKAKKIGPGKWRFNIDKGRRRIQRTEMLSDASAKRLKELLELEFSKDHLGIIEDEPVPPFKHFADKWLKFVSVRRSSRTYERYAYIINRVVNPKIGAVPINKITRGDIRDILLAYSEKGYSRSSVELVLTACSGVFNYALDEEVISAVPCRGLIRRLELGRKTDAIRPLSLEDMESALEAVPRRYYCLFLLLYQTGARIGEALALNWGDIDFKNRLIRIEKTAKDQTIKHSTKTYVDRDVEISGRLLPVLEREYKKDVAVCLERGVRPGPVFHEPDGRLLSDNTIRRVWSKACQKIGIGHKRPHDIRHTFASLHLSKNTPVVWVSRTLGHSSSDITLKKYARFIPDEDRGFIDRLSKVEHVAAWLRYDG